MPARANRILVKLRPGASLGFAESRANLRPLFGPRPRRVRETKTDRNDRPENQGFAAAGESRWYLANLRDAADNSDVLRSPWDLAHARVADQLGVAEGDVELAEPDVVATEGFPEECQETAGRKPSCIEEPQHSKNGEAIGPRPAWHLDSDFSQLNDARDAVTFGGRRTRIAHLDTGYYGEHVTLPVHLRKDLQKNFVEKDDDPGSAEDPDNDAFLLDNSGHGTGTLGILAGRLAPSVGSRVIGGAPEADIVPLRIADSVVLLYASAFARAVQYATDIDCDVLTMSMGGIPSNAWKEAINRAYLAGLFMVTAAGNNVNGLITRNIVYPARYRRVVAACGVMADGRPYAHLKGSKTLEGNHGPDKVMAHALCAYTPNMPWALYGCPNGVRHNGGGTSSATPQIAAAAAIWFEKYKGDLPRDWRRVDAARNALFKSAGAPPPLYSKSNGVLRAHRALAFKPVYPDEPIPEDNDSFAWLRVLTGLGLHAGGALRATPPPRERMFNLEIEQRLMLSAELQEIVPDADVDAIPLTSQLKFMEALIEDERASVALRHHLESRYPLIAGAGKSSSPIRATRRATARRRAHAFEHAPIPGPPPYRRLRVYAVDPSFASRLDTVDVNEATLHVRWEQDLHRGPAGEYLRVEPQDATGRSYPKVNLNAPALLATDGFAPSEGNPQFHQQMVYAVAMKTIEHFELALGRPVLWHHAKDRRRPLEDRRFVRQLVVRPFALRQANAYYSPDSVSLRFGYFEAHASGDGEGPTQAGDAVPGSRVYTCLSTDIVVHETTHAILDGIHRRFSEPTNPDVLAFHEAFADIVALLQHFTMRELLEHQICRTRGDIEADSMLGALAIQFGRASGARGALRSAIGSFDASGHWKRHAPDLKALESRLAPHDRGAVLVAAVFDAFIAIYKARIADLIRLNTGGTGVLPSGAIHPDLVGRLADEAAKSARHVLNMCIRALDYLPPVDVTFFEYLRALITADFDLVADDRHNYRVAFVESFRRHGIVPHNIEESAHPADLTLAVETLRWRGLDRVPMGVIRDVLPLLESYAYACLYTDDREELFTRTWQTRAQLQRALKPLFASEPAFCRDLGIDPKLRSLEVHQLRAAMRVGPDGRHIPQVIVGLTQSTRLDPNRGASAPSNRFRGGSTLVIDLAGGSGASARSGPEARRAPQKPTTSARIRYRIVKRIGSKTRLAATREFVSRNAADPLRALVLGAGSEPFAALHGFEEGRHGA